MKKSAVIELTALICRTGSTAFDLAIFHEAVVVVHHQVTFNLLEGVENNTDENQKGSTTEELREVLADAEEARERRKDGHDAKEE